MANKSKLFESVLKEDRIVVAGALLMVMALAWWYTLAGMGMGMNAFDMTQMPLLIFNEASGAAVRHTWDLQRFIVMLTMWWMMMLAMMLPSATPVILLAAAINQRSTSIKTPYGHALFFALGYSLAWLFFSLVAVLLQWWMEVAGYITPMMQNHSQYLAAALLIAAGVWQFSSLKQACLKHCRSPVWFLTRRRRPGNPGAVIMGAHHGLYCLGCCWFLMGLLFAVCIMNLYWIIGLALFVLIEKLFSRGVRFGQVAGILSTLAGVCLLVI